MAICSDYNKLRSLEFCIIIFFLFFGMIAFLNQYSFLEKSLLNSTLQIWVYNVFRFLHPFIYWNMYIVFMLTIVWLIIDYYWFHITSSWLSVWIFLHLCFRWTNELSKTCSNSTSETTSPSSADKYITMLKWICGWNFKERK